jgi:hypothetical protein
LWCDNGQQQVGLFVCRQILLIHIWRKNGFAAQAFCCIALQKFQTFALDNSDALSPKLFAFLQAADWLFFFSCTHGSVPCMIRKVLGVFRKQDKDQREVTTKENKSQQRNTKAEKFTLLLYPKTENLLIKAMVIMIVGSLLNLKKLEEWRIIERRSEKQRDPNAIYRFRQG